MATGNCCGHTIVPNIKTKMDIPANKVELAKRIYEFMEPIIKNGVTVPAGKNVTVVKLHNEFFDTHLSEHNFRDLGTSAANLRELYHQMRRGLIKFEEPIEEAHEPESVFPFHMNLTEQPETSTLPVDDKLTELKSDISAEEDPATKDIFFQPDYDRSNEKYSENVDIYKAKIKPDIAKVDKRKKGKK